MIMLKNIDTGVIKKAPTGYLNCTPKVGQKTTFGGAVFL